MLRTLTIGLTVVALIAALWAPVPTQAAGTAVIRIMPAGTSRTIGGNTPNPPGGVVSGYRLRLLERLTAAGMAVRFVGSQASGPSILDDRHHESYGGRTTQQGLDALPQAVQQFRPDIVLLELGAVDCAPHINDPANGPHRLLGIVDGIIAAYPPTRVIVANLGRSPDPDILACEQQFNASLAVLLPLRQRAGVPVTMINLYSALYPPTDMVDPLHLTTSGNNKWADLWYTAITEP